MYTWLLSFSYISNLSVLVDRVSSFSPPSGPAFEQPEKPKGVSRANNASAAPVRGRRRIAILRLFPSGSAEEERKNRKRA